MEEEIPAYVRALHEEGNIRTTNDRRMIQLDFLRGLAILMVLGSHYIVGPRDAGALKIPATMLARIGGSGVDLFFVLSGFLVGGLLMRELKVYGKLDVKRFLLRRGWKIWPVYYLYFLFLIVAFALNPDRFVVPKWQILAQYLLPLQNYNLFHLPYDVPVIAGHTWSLAVEEHFYLFLPLVLVFLGKDRRRLAWIPWIALALDGLCLALRLQLPPPFHPWSHQMPTHLRIDSLFTGVALAYWYHFRPEVMERAARLRGLLLGFGLLLIAPMCVWPMEEKRFVWTFGFTFLSVGYACLLTACVTSPVGEGALGKLFASRAARGLAAIGAFSYSIYVWHLDVVMHPMLLWVRHGALADLPATVRWPLLMSLYMAIAIGVGIFLAKLVETPTLRMRDRRMPARSDALGMIRSEDASPVTREEEIASPDTTAPPSQPG